MAQRTWARGAIFFAIMTVLTLLVALLWPTSDAAPAALKKQPGIVVMTGGSGCDKNVVATNAMLAQGFTQSEFVVGADQINWSEPEANERGSASFATATPTTAKALVEELRSDTDQAEAALSALIDESGTNKSELLKPENWTAVQFKVSSAWDGNTAYRNGDAVSAGTRTSSSGDVVWLFIKPAVCVKATAGKIPAVEAVVAHRAGCGNPQTELPRPVTPAPPTSPPGEVGKDHRLAPWSPPVLHCPDGQVMDRNSEQCVPWPPATTSTSTPGGSGQGDSGDGATNTTTPPTTVAPPATVPTTTPPTTETPPPTIPSL